MKDLVDICSKKEQLLFQAKLHIQILQPIVKLASTFGGETIVPSQYFNATNPVIITGATSGMQAKVIGFQDGTATTQPLLIFSI